jgi:phenylacetate-coenzyme A ligase PaaK-like adenylate-forming protein
MAITMPGTEGMHLLEDDLIFELHDDHTCVTNLFNDTMPLIRYRMDDVLVPDTGSRNPYPFTKVKEIVGRYEDALVFTNSSGRDDFIHPIVIVELIISGLDGWQIVLQSKTSFRFRARYGAGLDERQRQETRARIHEKLDALLAEKDMSHVRYEVEEVDELEIDPHSGKFRLVIKEPGCRQGTTPAAPQNTEQTLDTVPA